MSGPLGGVARATAAPAPAGPWAALARIGRARRMPAGGYLFFEGDRADAVFVIRSGLVKVSAVVGERDVVLDLVGAGELLGELSVIDGRPRSATAVALEPLEVCVVDADAFRRVLATDASVASAVLRSLSHRLRDASRRQSEHGGLDAQGRVCRRLVELMDRFGRADGEAIEIPTRLSQGDLAAWAGLSRESAVRALHAMRRLGWIRTSARSIAVVDARAVRARAALAPTG